MAYRLPDELRRAIQEHGETLDTGERFVFDDLLCIGRLPPCLRARISAGEIPPPEEGIPLGRTTDFRTWCLPKKFTQMTGRNTHPMWSQEESDEDEWGEW